MQHNLIAAYHQALLGFFKLNIVLLDAEHLYEGKDVLLQCASLTFLYRGNIFFIIFMLLNLFGEL